MSYRIGTARFKTKKNKRLPILLLILFSCVLTYVVLESTATTTPVDSLARAQEALARKDLESTRSLLRLPLGDSQLRSWALVLAGRSAEIEGKKGNAIGYYQQIPEISAASVDAALSLLRLGLESNPSLAERLPSVEATILRSNRSDLMDELLFTKAVVSFSQGTLSSSKDFLNQLRRRYTQSRFIRDAETLLDQIYSKDSSLAPSTSVANAVVESEMLVAANSALTALDLLQQQRNTVVEKSDDYFKLRLAEERVLRKLKRNEEADHVLLLLSADGGPGVADEALFRVARNHWNINDQGQALTFIDSLQSRFPVSPLLDEVLYTKGRILEEIDELPDARDTYTSLIARTSNQLLKVRSWGRIGWMYLRGENFAYAAAQFGSMRSAASDAMKAPTMSSSPDEFDKQKVDSLLRDLQLEFLHAAFWEAYSLQRLDASALPSLPYQAPSLDDLKQIFANANLFNYYSIAAKTQLKLISGELWPAATGEADCFSTVSQELTDLLHSLSSRGLRNLSDYEINWYASRANLPLNLITDGASVDVKLALSRVQLLNNFGQPKTAVSAAELLLRTLPSDKLSPTCNQKLIAFSYPTPYLEQFQHASSSNRVPLSLLYAISRTESYFDPSATSRVGALGLMQLMPATAKQEGLRTDEDIFDPSVNIRLGSAHLRRLLEEQDQNRHQAIAAYNAGTAAVNRWKTRYQGLDSLRWIEMVGYPETKDYVKKVIAAQTVYEQLLPQRVAESTAEKEERS